MLSYLYLIGGIAIIIFGADRLVDGASAIAKRFKIPDLVIGLTIVSFGTSAPELTVNLMASLNGNTDIAIGNVLGSNIFNVFAILGVSAIIYPISVTSDTTWKEIPLSLLAAVVLGLLANDMLIDGDASSVISRIDGLILLSFFGIFMYYTFNAAKKGMAVNAPVAEAEADAPAVIPIWKSSLYVVLGLICLILGGNGMVTGAVEIAQSLGVSEAVIGLTVVAVGTSVPELATSAVAAYKKNSDIAVGNVVGSNIFNIFFILGVSGSISPLPFHETSNIDILMGIFAALMVFTFTMVGKGRQISRGEGIIFVLIYIVYTVYLVMNA